MCFDLFNKRHKNIPTFELELIVTSNEMCTVLCTALHLETSAVLCSGIACQTLGHAFLILTYFNLKLGDISFNKTK